MDTKERIMWEAVKLFAKEGYEAVSVSQIADQLGMTKSALYKHYKNKRDIFDSILHHMETLDQENASSCSMPEWSSEVMPEAYQQVEIKELVDFSVMQFRYWTEDEFAVSFRRLLTLEQYRNEEMRKLYQQYLASGPLRYVEDVFIGMGVDRLKAKDMALDFYAPMFLMYSIYDGMADGDNIVEQLKDHICLFLKKFTRRK